MCIWDLVSEDCKCPRATKPVGHNYWAWVPRACGLHQEKHRTEKPVHCNYRVAPARWKYRSPEQQWRPAAAAAAKSLQSCPTLWVPLDGSPPGPPIPGILQARTVEWVAISFSNAWKWKVKVKSLSRVWPSATPWTAAYQAPPSMGFCRSNSTTFLSFPK